MEQHGRIQLLSQAQRRSVVMACQDALTGTQTSFAFLRPIRVVMNCSGSKRSYQRMMVRLGVIGTWCTRRQERTTTVRYENFLQMYVRRLFFDDGLLKLELHKLRKLQEVLSLCRF